jgi:hypothetical protein
MIGNILAAVAVPPLPVSTYGGELLSLVSTVVSSVLPYAAAFTVLVVGLVMVKRWLGHRTATTLGDGRPGSHWHDDYEGFQ